MLAKSFLGVARRGQSPDEWHFPFFNWEFFFTPNRFHLFASDLPHFLIIKNVFGLFILRRPQNSFCRVREITAGKIWRRVGFFPRDVVEDFEAELLHGVAD